MQDLNFDRPLEAIDISATEVEKLLHELNTVKSMGPDNPSIFAPKTVKNTMSSFGYHISKVGFNRDNPKRVEICKGDTIVQEGK